MADQSGRFVHAKKAGHPVGYPGRPDGPPPQTNGPQAPTHKRFEEASADAGEAGRVSEGVPGLFCVYESATSARHYDTIISLYSL